MRSSQVIGPAARVETPGGSTGSGFVMANSAENGTYVLTNHHVIQSCIEQHDRWDPVEKSSSKVERLMPVDVSLYKYDDRGRHTQTVVTTADIVAYSQYGDQCNFEGDLAVLKLRSPVAEVPAARVIVSDDFDADVRVLDDIVMVGCPEGSGLPLPTTGNVASLTEERADISLVLS